MSSQPQPSSSSSTTTTLTATYASPQSPPFTLTQQLTLPETATPSQQQKSAYLHDLRKSAFTIQEQLNKKLTQLMEEDKAREAGSEGGAKKKSAVIDDEAEEENYGEEVVGDSD